MASKGVKARLAAGGRQHAGGSDVPASTTCVCHNATAGSCAPCRAVSASIAGILQSAAGEPAFLQQLAARGVGLLHLSGGKVGELLTRIQCADCRRQAIGALSSAVAGGSLEVGGRKLSYAFRCACDALPRGSRVTRDESQPP
jgi:hypothetical protein